LLLPSWRETYSRFLNTLILKVFMWWKQWMYLSSCSKVDEWWAGTFIWFNWIINIFSLRFVITHCLCFFHVYFCMTKTNFCAGSPCS
jgi:hypothetical protein